MPRPTGRRPDPAEEQRRTRDEQRNRVRALIRQRMREMNLNVAELCRITGLDNGTLGDFINGETRWPHPRTRTAVEAALDLPKGYLEQAASTPLHSDINLPDTLRSVAIPFPETSTSQVLLDAPPGVFDGLTPAEQAEAVASAQQSFLAKARELRALHREP